MVSCLPAEQKLTSSSCLVEKLLNMEFSTGSRLNNGNKHKQGCVYRVYEKICTKHCSADSLVLISIFFPRLFRPGCCGGLHAQTRCAPAQWRNLPFNVLFLRDVNTAVMELLVMAYALKTSCAKNIIGVIPYFPYSKQCKMRKRGSIVCKLLASMLAKAGMSPCNSFCHYWLAIICHLYSHNCRTVSHKQQTMASLVGSSREWQLTKGLYLKFLVLIRSSNLFIDLTVPAAVPPTIRDLRTFILPLHLMLARLWCCRTNTHHHNGPSPEGDPGLLQLPRGQPPSFPVPHPVHPGGGEVVILYHGQGCAALSVPNISRINGSCTSDPRLALRYQHFPPQIPDYRNAIIVAKSPSAAKR